MTTHTVEVAKWFHPYDLPDSAKSKLFGELVKLAMPILERYHSDLYHDALYIDRYVDTPGSPAQTLEFYYAIDEGGTSIGDDTVILEFRKTAQYKVTLVNHEMAWSAVITDLL